MASTYAGEDMTTLARPLPLTSAGPPAAAATPSKPSPLWLCCHFPELGLEALKLRPEAVAAVWTSSASDGPLIHAATRGARARGITPGMARDAALALCRELRLEARDAAAERACQQRLARIALNYSPWVSLDYPAAIVLEIRGSLGLFGGSDRLLQRLRSDFTTAGHRPLLAAAPLPGPAWLLAQQGREAVVEDPAALRSALGGLPIGCLPLPPPLPGRLAQAGLRILRDLWRLPREGLARRYGTELLAWLDRASGRWTEPPQPFRPPERFDLRRRLAVETEQLPLLLQALERLLVALSDFLCHRDAVTDRLELALEHDRRPPTRIGLQLRSRSRDPAHLHRLLAERLERTSLPAPVLALRLTCADLHARRAENTELFSTPLPPTALDWDRLLERLQQRLGRDSLKFLGTVADHRPEQAQRLDGPSDGRFDHGDRPLWLLHEPRPCDPHHYRLLAERERIETGWWDGVDIRRDYRVGVAPDGARAWLYRDLARGGWYLQGWFG